MASAPRKAARQRAGTSAPALAHPTCASLSAALPPGAAGQWCEVHLRLPQRAVWWARLELADTARDQIVRACFLGPRRRVPGGWARATLVHVPAEAGDLKLHIIGAGAEGARLRIRRLSRLGATLRLLWFGRDKLFFSLVGSAQGRLGRLRAVLGQAPARAGQAPPYQVWINLCEPGLPPPPEVSWCHQVAITEGDPAALAASLAALAGQRPAWHGEPLIIRTPSDWRRVTAPWVVILRADEILASSALASFTAAVAAYPTAALITADFDQIGLAGDRRNPVLKPGADALLVPTGLATQGACAVRWPAQAPDLPAQGEEARRLLALEHPDALVHIPRILTHCGPRAAPAALTPVTPRRAAGFAPRVTALVPTALRSAHVPACLRRIVQETDYPAFAVDLALSNAKADPRHLREVQALPGLRIQKFEMPSFNFAAVTNAAASRADGELLLLLNDDVAPIMPDWLSAMVAHMQDPRVGVVGARLLYGNGMVQHEGVIMGLAHLCEHAGRLRPGNDVGAMGIGLIDRQVSAVTAACLLIRADLYRRLGGMDESFAIALNDVDLCLRARAAGARVVYCAHAALWHYESLSLGRHYAGTRAALEAVEVRRLRGRWADVISEDPFYNPLASLEPGREWQPGFPPRGAGLTKVAPNPAAIGS